MLRDLMNKKFAGQVTKGKHEAVITGYEYVEAKNNPDYDYIKLTMTLDGNRPYTRNMFEKDMSIFLSHTRQQLRMNNTDIMPFDYLHDLIDNKTKLNVWFAYPTVQGRDGTMKRVQNVNWAPPLEKASENTLAANALDNVVEMESPL